LLQQNLNLTFGFFEFLAAGVRQLNSFFEELEGLLQSNIATFEFVDDFLQP